MRPLHIQIKIDPPRTPPALPEQAPGPAPEAPRQPSAGISGQAAWLALAALVLSVCALFGLDLATQRYADAQAAQGRVARELQCERLHTLLGEFAAAADPTVAARRASVNKAYEHCWLALAQDPGFVAHAPPASRVPGRLESFLFSAQSAGHNVYKMALAVLYAVSILSLALLLLFALESRFGANQTVPEFVASVRSWMGGHAASESPAAAWAAGLVVPAVLAAPVVLAGTLALQAEPLELAVRPASFDLQPRLVDASGLPLSDGAIALAIAPRLDTQGLLAPVPVRFEPVVLPGRPPTSPPPPRRCKPTTQTVHVSLPALEPQLAAALERLGRADVGTSSAAACPREAGDAVRQAQAPRPNAAPTDPVAEAEPVRASR